ncbi:hypothetical protein BK025_14145 [Sodalis sp. TME1]|nr:hypothetical protein BK025_14145 [Sodalis sp. TME1]
MVCNPIFSSLKGVSRIFILIDSFGSVDNSGDISSLLKKVGDTVCKGALITASSGESPDAGGVEAADWGARAVRCARGRVVL